MAAPQKSGPKNETQIIYSMLNVSKEIDRKKILTDVSISYYYGAKIGVLGLNGSGKSTLLKILAGLDKNYEGKIMAANGYTIGYLEQEPLIDDTRTVMEVVRDGAKVTFDLLRQYDEINAKFGEDMTPEQMDKLMAKQATVQEELDRREAWTIDSQLEMAMEALRCPPADQACNTLSGGERRRVALCTLLLTKPDILLLDEPTNHLDAESVTWLEQHLQRFEGTIIAVTHDRYFLDNVAGWILELDRGQCIAYKGNYTGWLEQKKKRLEVEEKHASTRQKALARELEWIGRNPQGRMAKNKARVERYEQLAGQNQKERAAEVEIFIPAGPRLGTLVVEAKGLCKAYGEKVLLDDVNFTIPAGAIVGIIGPNGAGKTTLFRMIIGTEQPDSGEMRVGESVKLAYVEQSRETLPNDKNLWEAISGGEEKMMLGGVETNSRAYVARFGFTGTDQSKIVGSLSGGERNRVHLARMLKEGANVILLDEPTNDIDVNTMRALEDGMESFVGCVVVISHDRWFLDRVATHILAFEGDSKVFFYNGNYSAYEADRHRRMGLADDAPPRRLQYRALSR
ncbi:MAG: energy-dependent translational throttle protein EttA [Planctomycetota bacterium]|nr:MAG: energy-dependent translational throttle protein EttA [Planctomycetota bacterium]